MRYSGDQKDHRRGFWLKRGSFENYIGKSVWEKKGEEREKVTIPKRLEQALLFIFNSLFDWLRQFILNSAKKESKTSRFA